MRVGRLSTLILAATTLVLSSTPVVAFADSIYLKSGRVLRTADARIEGDRVVFLLYGLEQSLPMSVVDRVVEDEHTGLAPRPTEGSVSTGDEEVDSDEGADDRGAGDDPERVDPEQTREYWQQRVLAIRAEEVILEEQMQRLRRIERAFLFSHRSTTDIKLQIAEVEEMLQEVREAPRELRREARRKGIPPGWLRVRG